MKTKKQLILFLLVISSILLFFNSCDIINMGATSGEGWTFMIYMAGDNSLTEEVFKDIIEMEQGLHDSYHGGNSSLNDDLKVLVLKDQEYSNDTKLYLIQPDNDQSKIESKVIENDIYKKYFELDMSEPETLKSFVSYAMEECPSKHYALVMWNHGGGVRSTKTGTETTREFCEDDGNYMYTNELQQALNDVLTEDAENPPLSIIGFDACLMGITESAYEYRALSSYYTGSMANEWGLGWDYQEIFGTFNKAGSPPSASEMADILVNQYYTSTKDATYSTLSHTLTSVDTSKLETLKSKIDTLAAAIYNNGDSSYKEEFHDQRDNTIYPPYDANNEIVTKVAAPYYDLYDLCVNIEASSVFNSDVKDAAIAVKNALSESIVACYAKSTSLNYNYFETADEDALRGLTIFIPNGEKIYNSSNYYAYSWWYTSEVKGNEGGLDFCSYNKNGIVESWRELFEAWYKVTGAEY